MRLAVSCIVLLITGWGAPAPQQADPSELIRQARDVLRKDTVKGRPEAERLLRDARRMAAGKSEVYSEASILLALVLLGGTRPATEIRSIVDEILPVYERAEDAKLALALEIKAAVSPSGEAEPLQKRASAIRMKIISDLTRQSDDPPPDPRGVYRVADTSTPPRIREKPEPPYAEAARIAKHQGAVLLSFIIDTKGEPGNIRLVRSLGFDLDEAAWHTVRKWRFDPATRQGEPVRVSANVEINFRLL
jgi:TonB family protein